MAGINPDGTLDASFPIKYRDLAPVEVGFVALIEYADHRDRYFITSNPGEFGLLDRGEPPGWYRTGYAFRAFPSGKATPSSVPVCRFFGKPELGLGTHFFTADPQEVRQPGR
jgi:hypothetical protein